MHFQEAESSHAEEMGLAQVELQRAVQQCAALQADLDSRAAPDEVAALHARIETLRHLVDVQEEIEGARQPPPHDDIILQDDNFYRNLKCRSADFVKWPSFWWQRSIQCRVKG